ncbi:hypothetical protein ABGB12_26335 [Actinocorallia sp. B10E7]|uniref:hypothetical protein n=1 Tax=Actinocorallia sp. B10E7 TaxID=3153558 RepID=UPI00325DCC41
MMNTPFEQRCDLLLRSYPPRYRQIRRDEILGTLLDAAEPHATAPSVRECWDVIRGGIATRLRERPPFHRWLAYRLMDIPVPYRYRMWVRDDALGRFHILRSNLGHLVFMYLVMLATWAWMAFTSGDAALPAMSPTAWTILAVGAVITVVNPLFHQAFRRRILLKHDFDEDGRALGFEQAQPEPPYESGPADRLPHERSDRPE